jgi:hypothetical protein
MKMPPPPYRILLIGFAFIVFSVLFYACEKDVLVIHEDEKMAEATARANASKLDCEQIEQIILVH